MVKFCNFCFKNLNFEPKMAIFNYSGIRSLLFEYSNNIRSPKSDRISNRITLFGTQLFEYSNNSNYSFKHCLLVEANMISQGLNLEYPILAFTTFKLYSRFNLLGLSSTRHWIYFSHVHTELSPLRSQQSSHETQDRPSRRQTWNMSESHL